MSFQFPPYGVFADHYADTVKPNNLAPFKWISKSGNSESNYLSWRAEVLADISSTLWPLWSRETAGWINPDHDHMLALTKADFELMEKLNKLNTLLQKPSVSKPEISIPSHLDFFKEEDETNMGKSFQTYHNGFSPEQVRQKVKALSLMRSYFGSVSIQLKTEIQRPRAYQVSLMMGRPFSWKLAKSAVTSSMSSGHCFQGCILGCLIYDRWLANGLTPNEDALNALKQFTVDIGDRRVFAGVHYPSDNLASWLITLKIIPKVFENPTIAEFAVSAIAEHSLVWKCIKESNKNPYAAAVKKVEQTMLSSVQAGFSWTPFSSQPA